MDCEEKQVRARGPVPCQSIPPSAVMPVPYDVATLAIDGLEGAIVTLITGYGKADDQEPPPSAV